MKRIKWCNLLHLSDSDLLLELQQRGYDINPLLRQKRKQVFQAADVISMDAVRHVS